MILVGKYSSTPRKSSKYIFLENLLRSSKKSIDPSPKFEFLVALDLILTNCLDRKRRSEAIFFLNLEHLMLSQINPYLSFGCSKVGTRACGNMTLPPFCRLAKPGRCPRCVVVRLYGRSPTDSCSKNHSSCTYLPASNAGESINCFDINEARYL